MTQTELLPRPTEYKANEFKVIALRDAPAPEKMFLCDTPEVTAKFWRENIEPHPAFNPECECMVVLHLNVRLKVKGYQLLTVGTQDTLLVHPREVYRAAVISSSAGIVLMHNHPSGDATPSSADISVTRDLIRAGQLIKIQLQDHVIIGRGERPYVSLREQGYFN